MKDLEDTKVLIVGHTDSKRDASYNQKLSERRAHSAGTYPRRQGIAAKRFIQTGKGEAEPVASNDTEVGRQQNRRGEVAVYANEAFRERARRKAESRQVAHRRLLRLLQLQRVRFGSRLPNAENWSDGTLPSQKDRLKLHHGPACRLLRGTVPVWA